MDYQRFSTKTCIGIRYGTRNASYLIVNMVTNPCWGINSYKFTIFNNDVGGTKATLLRKPNHNIESDSMNYLRFLCQ